MSGRVVLDPEADRDIDDQFDYFAGRSIDAAQRFLEAAAETFQLLARMPGFGSSSRYNHPQLSRVRWSPIRGFHNYLVFYHTLGDGIRILRVLHGARNIASIFERPTEEPGPGTP